MESVLHYAERAHAAYPDLPTYGDENSAGRANVYDDGKTVAFPGTDNIACWLADLDVDVITVPGLGGIHEGFWDAYNLIHADVIKLAPEVSCGHSEGAALALIYGAMLCLAGKPPKAIYAFEAPRITIDDTIGNLFKAHNVPVYIYRNGNDIVPMVPRLVHDWRHPAPLIAIGEPSLPIWNVEDHFMKHVIAALKTI